MKKNGTAILFLVLGVFFVSFFLYKKKSPPQNETEIEEAQKMESTVIDDIGKEKNSSQKMPRPLEANVSAPEMKAVARPSMAVMKPLSKDQKPGEILRYVMDDGVAVVQGDIVAGVPINPAEEALGYVKAPVIKLWPSREIAFHIQPSVKNPERIHQALALFSATAIRFVPYTNQEDALVFEDSNGVCKSYVGKIGGKQPIWVPLGCEASEIAHELMHALGFVHEQNRTDRDQFVEVIMENIDPQYKENFALLPAEMMRISGLAPFDFESLMIYPVSMFAKPGQSTMRAKDNRETIRPGESLSARDVERINLAFGGLPPERSQ